MIININNLSKEILNKIPISILLNLKNDEIDISKLPVNIAYELKQYELKDKITPFANKNSVDLVPSFSVYTDFKTLNSKKEAIIEYAKNFLQIDKGAYPFDPTFGTEIKKFLQMLDTETAKIAINTELNKITGILSLAFNVPLNIIVSSLIPSSFENYLEYTLQVELQVEEDRPTSMTITKSIENYYLL